MNILYKTESKDRKQKHGTLFFTQDTLAKGHAKLKNHTLAYKSIFPSVFFICFSFILLFNPRDI